MAAAKSFTTWTVVGVVALIALWSLTTYNALVTSRENVDTSWRQVETQYQRRFDLIPSLVNTVRGAANFEQSTLTQVTEARTKWLGAGGDRAQQVEAAQEADSALARLLVSVESYPQLQATQAFRDLMVQLEGTENRITVARLDYNNEVRDYNLMVRRVPSNILAGIFGFDAEPGFEAAEGAEIAPEVQFD